MRTSGHTVLITSSAGSGLALAEAFHDAGNEVLLCVPPPVTPDTAVEHWPDLRTIACNVASVRDRRHLLQAVRAHAPHLNVLVNNIGDETELHVSMMLTLALLPYLHQHPEAAVINVATAPARVPLTAYPAYRAARAGLHTFSTMLRQQLHSTPVEVFEVLLPAHDIPTSTARGPCLRPVMAAVLAGLRRGDVEMRIGQPQTLSVMTHLLPQVAASLHTD